MAESRFSPYSVADDLLRADLYRELKAASPEWPIHEIQPDEVGRPDLVSFRVYGTIDLDWVILIVSGITDPRENMESGVRLSLPPIIYVRERIKHYTGTTA